MSELPRTGSAIRVLIVDDEPNVRKTLAICLESEGCEVATACDVDEAMREVKGNPFDLALVDLRLDDVSGLDLIPELLEHAPGIGIIVITAYASVETAIEAMKLGAVDYLPKPFTPAQVRLVVQNVAERRRLQHEVTTLRHQLRRAYPDVSIDSRNAGMRRTIEMARQVARGDSTVLLVGESGTGKGLLARAIHEWSTRAERPFVTVHCPSLSTELFESELFGHAKGAFTSAVKANPGRVSYAERGTLFLDEIGDLPASMQGKLLRFIQDREYERVGDPNTRRADVRLVAATNHDLQQAVQENRFREDLYYRLNVVAIETPPLRSRPEDILPLAAQFLKFFAIRDSRSVTHFTPEVKAELEGHTWPGNVRELQNVIERAVIFSMGGEIGPGDLVLGSQAQGEGTSIEHGFVAGGSVTLEELEREHILRTIAQTRTLEEAARILDIDPSTLWRRRKAYEAS